MRSRCAGLCGTGGCGPEKGPMTTVGHTLFGLALGVLVLPLDARRRFSRPHLVAFALLANVPDFPLPGWGHDLYQVSHSLFVTCALIAAAALCLRSSPRALRAVGGGRVVLAGAGAWAGHLLLDSLYNHGRGIAIFWPFSSAHLALPVPWFARLEHGPALDPASLRIFAVEGLVYGSLLAACGAFRFVAGAPKGDLQA
jgi:hypothetical protein